MSVSLSQVPFRRSPLAVKNFFNSLNPVKHIALDGKAPPRLFWHRNPCQLLMPTIRFWFRVSQLADKHKQFTENAIRAQIFG